MSQLSVAITTEKRPGVYIFYNVSVSGIHAVHDVTVGYPYNIPENEFDLLKGEFPKEVHFHIKRYSINEVMFNYFVILNQLFLLITRL